MKRQRREEIARAEMYDEGVEALAEYRAQCWEVRPGACDERFGGGVKERVPVGYPVSAGTTPTTKRVPCKRCVGTGWDEGLYTPCRRCKPFYDGTHVVRGTVLMPVKER